MIGFAGQISRNAMGEPCARRTPNLDIGSIGKFFDHVVVSGMRNKESTGFVLVSRLKIFRPSVYFSNAYK